YSYDVRLPGMLHGRILRSPYAHSRVKHIDVSAAKRIAGVRAVVTVQQMRAQDRSGAPASGGSPSSVQQVRYEGEQVASVAWLSPEVVDEAFPAARGDYEVLRHVGSTGKGVKPGAPKVLGEGNIEEKEKKGEQAKVQDAFKQCQAIVEAEYRTQTIHHSCLETHGMVIDYRGKDSATVYASTQSTFSIPPDTAKALDLKDSKIT